MMQKSRKGIRAPEIRSLVRGYATTDGFNDVARRAPVKFDLRENGTWDIHIGQQAVELKDIDFVVETRVREFDSNGDVVRVYWLADQRPATTEEIRQFLDNEEDRLQRRNQRKSLTQLWAEYLASAETE